MRRRDERAAAIGGGEAHHRERLLETLRAVIDSRQEMEVEIDQTAATSLFLSAFRSGLDFASATGMAVTAGSVSGCSAMP